MSKKHVGPWLRKSDLCWYTTVKGELIKLGTAQDDREAVQRAYLAAHGVSRLTVAELVGKFLAAAKLECKPTTYRWYAGFLGTFRDCNLELKLPSGRKLVIISSTAALDVTSTIATSWIQKLYGSSSASTQNAAARTVSRLFNWAVTEKYFPDSPIKGMQKPKAGRREFFVNGEQYAICLRNCGLNLRDPIKFLRHTGCRPQELRAIEAAWITDGKVTFPYLVKRKRRVIFLDDMADKIAAKLSAKYPTGPIFRNTDEKPWSRHGLTCAFKRLRTKIAMPGLCAYSFRHGYITRLLENNVDVATVAAISGNSARMVFDVYNHAGQNESRLHSIVRTRLTDTAV